MNEDNIPAKDWFKWLDMGRRYEHNQRVKQAIKALKPRAKKPPLQMPGMPLLDNPQSNPEDDEDSPLP